MAILTDSIVSVLLKIFAGDSPIRERISDPGAIIEGAGVRPGQTVLEETRISPRDEREFTIGWAIFHAL